MHRKRLFVVRQSTLNAKKYVIAAVFMHSRFKPQENRHLIGIGACATAAAAGCRTKRARTCFSDWTREKTHRRRGARRSLGPCGTKEIQVPHMAAVLQCPSTGPRASCRARWRCPRFRPNESPRRRLQKPPRNRPSHGTISLVLHPDPPFPRDQSPQPLRRGHHFRSVSPICRVRSRSLRRLGVLRIKRRRALAVDNCQQAARIVPMTRSRHPDQHIERAIQYAESRLDGGSRCPTAMRGPIVLPPSLPRGLHRVGVVDAESS